ncbi:MAG: hypothetical protein IPL87_03615 [Candidatus Moraniibacteriota bacterium]|nr:MAG: hypothetical protein IPL87_03615 [Candidatus Moranbacteria bacterium]
MALNSRPFSPLPSPTPAPKSDDVFLFSRLSFLWITCLFGAFFLAVFGEFLRTGVFFLSGGFLAGIGITLWKFRPSRELLMWGVAFFLLAFSISFISSPTVFSGRDQGSYANAAIRLVETESLQSRSLVSDTFFSLYGPGKALNFPGFFYTSEGALTSQFPLGSIVWFGLNFSLFGVSGFSVANSLSPLFFFDGTLPASSTIRIDALCRRGIALTRAFLSHSLDFRADPERKSCARAFHHTLSSTRAVS